MLRGCQREMIVMQTGDSALFESAYFILRRHQVPRGKADMLAEANRIIGEGVTVRKKRSFSASATGFFLGLLVGACIFALFSFLPIYVFVHFAESF